MRRFIVSLLILAVLVTNVAWAVDDCFLPYSQTSNDVSGLILPGNLPDDRQNDGVCDDLCIGWLHLVAITSGSKLDYFPSTRQDVARTNLPFHSRRQAPPVRPPQI